MKAVVRLVGGTGAALEVAMAAPRLEADVKYL